MRQINKKLVAQGMLMSLIVVATCIFLASLIMTSSKSVWPWLSTLPWGWIGLGTLGVIVLASLIYAVVKKPEWRDKAKDFFGSSVGLAGRLVAGVLIAASIPVTLILIGVTMSTLTQRYQMPEAQASVQASMSQVMSETEAARHRSDIVVLPDSAITFVVVATQGENLVYKVREHYCVNTEAVTLSESYDYLYQGGVVKVRPDKPTEKFGRSLWFSLRAFGGPTTEVKVSSYKETPNGKCQLPSRFRD